MKRSGPIARKTPLSRGSRLSPMSVKRRVESRIYSAKRKAFLAAKFTCEMCLNQPSRDIHHTAKRGKNYLNESTWMAVCRNCHEIVHNNPSMARTLGFLV